MDFLKIGMFLNRDWKEDSILEFLVNDERKNDEIYDYIVCKVISQLEIRDHIYKMGPIVECSDSSRIIRELYDNKDCSLFKTIIKKSKEYSGVVSLIDKDELIHWIRDDYFFIKESSLEEVKDDFYMTCNHYFDSVSCFEECISSLQKDIIGNLYMYRFVFCENHLNKSLENLLDDIRITMNGKMVNIGERVKEYRDYDISLLDLSNEDKDFFESTTKACDIEEEMHSLSEKYESLKKIEDRDEYIKKGVEVFQDFIRIHPYQNGNGRTSRLLLDIILVNRNILPPILYKTYYDRYDLDIPSREYTIRGNITPITLFIEERIKKTYEEYNVE